MKINLHIERLVVDGLPVESRDGSLIRAALTNALAQRLAGGDLKPDLVAGGALSHLPAVGIQYSSETTPSQLGRNIAEAVHSSIRSDAEIGRGNPSGLKPSAIAVGTILNLCFLIAALLSVAAVNAQPGKNTGAGKLAARTSTVKRPQIDPSSVQVRPGTDVQVRPGTDLVPGQPSTFNLNLQVDRGTIQVGEQVTFTLKPEISTALTFMCDFGDGVTMEFPRDSYTLTHVYEKARDQAYNVTVTVSVRGKTVDQSALVGNKVTVKVDGFTLTVEPRRTETGQPVTFSVQPVATDPNIRYRIGFGLRSAETDWQSEPSATYSYSSKNTYRPYLLIGRMTDGVVRQITRVPGGSLTITAAVNPNPTDTVTPNPITPTPTPIPPILRPEVIGVGLLGLLIAVSVPVVGYKVWKRVKNHRIISSSANTTFHPHADPGDPVTKDVSGPLVEVRTSIRSGGMDALTRLVAEGPLVLSVRRSDA
jgi:hypothetical protein